MNVAVNGKNMLLADNSSLPSLIESMGFQDNSSAVWINGRKLQFREYSETVLRGGDNVKIMQIVIGG